MCYSAVPMQYMLLHLVSERLEVSNHFNDLLAGLLVVFKDLIISQISKHIYFAYHFHGMLDSPATCHKHNCLMGYKHVCIMGDLGFNSTLKDFFIYVGNFFYFNCFL